MLDIEVMNCQNRRMKKRSRHFWYCNACEAQNSREDGECQFCECGGLGCKRDSCSAPEHFHADHLAEGEPFELCPLCTKAA